MRKIIFSFKHKQIFCTRQFFKSELEFFLIFVLNSYTYIHTTHTHTHTHTHIYIYEYSYYLPNKHIQNLILIHKNIQE